MTTIYDAISGLLIKNILGRIICEPGMPCETIGSC
jgi:hypothetical protein